MRRPSRHALALQRELERNARAHLEERGRCDWPARPAAPAPTPRRSDGRPEARRRLTDAERARALAWLRERTADWRPDQRARLSTLWAHLYAGFVTEADRRRIGALSEAGRALAVGGPPDSAAGSPGTEPADGAIDPAPGRA